MRKKSPCSTVMRNITRYAITAVTTLALMVQPCLMQVTFATTGYYSKESNYPDWDDPDFNYSYYWEEDISRKITNVSRSYSDGTKYTATYKYNDQGNMTDANIKEADGSRITIKRVYSGENLVSSTLNEYNAEYKVESTHLTEYGNEQTPTHELITYSYSDKTTARDEQWFYSSEAPLKKIKVERSGTTATTEYTYTEQGSPLTSRSISSDGSESTTEYRYDGEGNTIYYKEYEYDSILDVRSSSEAWLEGDYETGIAHAVEIEIHSNDPEHRIESWTRMSDNSLSKRIVTNTDGSQYTEEYSYDSDGLETLYTKTGNGIPTERRETTKTADGTTTTYSDGVGNRSVSSDSYDKINQLSSQEVTTTNADGSSSYTKRVYSHEDYTYTVDIVREKTADGVETYRELTEDKDGNSTVKEKDKDGTITTTVKDAAGNERSKSKILSDGTRSDTSYEYHVNGEVATILVKYSDGRQDRSDYEYNENNDIIKLTESRRNGVTAVILMQYGTNEGTVSGSITYNNGYSASWSYVQSNENNSYTGSFSHGEVAQDMVSAAGTQIHVKTTYRDGRIDEFSANYEDEAFYLGDGFEKILAISDRLDSFIDEAWTILPNQAETDSQTATTSNTSPVIEHK